MIVAIIYIQNTLTTTNQGTYGGGGGTKDSVSSLSPINVVVAI